MSRTNCYHERDLASGRCSKCGAQLGALVRLMPLRPMLGTISKAEREGPLEQLADELRRRRPSVVLEVPAEVSEQSTPAGQLMAIQSAVEAGDMTPEQGLELADWLPAGGSEGSA